jgi:hypothetical protein
MFVIPDEDFLNLEHAVQTHEAELDRISKEITALMDDLKVLIECNQGWVIKSDIELAITFRATRTNSWNDAAAF